MHMFSVEKKFYGGHGIVGAQVPLGTGLGFANKYRGNGGVCVAYFGDGAPTRARSTRASTWRAVEAAGHLRDREQPICDGHQRQALLRRGPAVPSAASFEYSGLQVDGMDVLAVREARREEA
jgi:pyruvate dehydrogenase E1 component alpha subunit